MLAWMFSRLRPTFAPIWLERHADCLAYLAQLERSGMAARRQRREHRLAAAGGERFVLPAHCYPCGVQRRLEVDYLYSTHPGLPNWRERLTCPVCGLNNRLRATVHVLEERLGADRETSRLYLTEQRTPLYQWIKTHYRHVVGSEYLGTAFLPGEIAPDGVRNESLLRLTFPADTFDCVLSFDVLEHIPDYPAALRECWRCLKPGGSLLLTVPFDFTQQQTLIRARLLPSGEIEHLEAPEYHGDPVNQAGCLAFYTFGWQFLDELRAIGFERVGSYGYYSREYGYLGSNTWLFIARKCR